MLGLLQLYDVTRGVLRDPSSITQQKTRGQGVQYCGCCMCQQQVLKVATQLTAGIVQQRSSKQVMNGK
jgi:hypothetical protein